MRRGLGSLLLDLLTIGIVILMLMPIVWVFLASFKPDPEIMAATSGQPTSRWSTTARSSAAATS